ncbi:MAG: DNA-directed RNA polymerase [Candidatus Nanoarchaeia archaeon]
MYYKSEVQGVVRVPPKFFGEKLERAVERQLKEEYEGKVVDPLGKVIRILDISEIGEGTIIPGDGAAYHRTNFTVIHYIPEIGEIVEGEIKDIAKFGAFIDFGPFEGMVHISQTMDDFVSFSKSGALSGKKTGRTLKVGDRVRARIIAISYKDPYNPKIGLTMRQPLLGKLEWIDAEVKGEKKKKEAEKNKK